jgi:spore coat protein A
MHLRTGVEPMLEFRISSGGAHNAPQIPTALVAVPRLDPATAVRRRTISLHEYDNKTGQPRAMLLNRKRWHDPVTEIVSLDSTEIWEFVNLTEDTHPMHLHLAHFQILDRRSFDPFEYLTYGRMRYTGVPEMPPAHELGWKDVVPCPAGMVTRIIVLCGIYRTISLPLPHPGA